MNHVQVAMLEAFCRDVHFNNRNSCISTALIGRNDLPDPKDAVFFNNDAIIIFILQRRLYLFRFLLGMMLVQLFPCT